MAGHKLAFWDVEISHFFKVLRGYKFATGKSGAQGRDRTADTAIFSRMLYQLSYLGTSADERKPRL
jgi:hypothetical protein